MKKVYIALTARGKHVFTSKIGLFNFIKKYHHNEYDMKMIWMNEKLDKDGFLHTELVDCYSS